MRRAWLLAMCFVMASASGDLPQREAIAQAPVPSANDAPSYELRVEIQGPEGKTIQAGKPIKLVAVVKVVTTAAGRETVFPFDDAPTAYEWSLANAPDGYNLAEWTDSAGTSVVFADPAPGAYYFQVAVSRWTGGPKPLLKTAKLTLVNAGGSGPTPPAPVPPTDPVPPTPGPTPPTPPAPDPLAGFPAEVRDAAVRLVPADAIFRAGAVALAYKDGAKALGDGLWTVKTAPEKQRELNSAAMGTDRPKWKAWSDWIGAKLGEEDSAGRLSTEAQVAAKWAQISLGLSEVGK